MALHHIPNRTKKLPPLRVGIGGPVGSGNCASMRSMASRLMEASSRMAVCGQPPVSTPMMRSAGSAPATVSRRWSSLV